MGVFFMEAACYCNDLSISMTNNKTVVFDFYYKDPKIPEGQPVEKVLIRSIAIEGNMLLSVLGPLYKKLSEGEEPPQSGKSRI